MKKSQAWQDTIGLLSGARVPRPDRPGEVFAEEELIAGRPHSALLPRLYRWLSQLFSHTRVTHPAPFRPLTDQPEYRYRKG
jgi:hypothetical protein